MSWPKILKTARRLGAPVIVTDQAGLDPMIILPLEAYEGLIGEDEGAKRPSRSKRGEIDESIFEIPSEEGMPIMNLDEMPQPSQKDEKLEALKGQESEEGENPEISLEERFYFEPLEDEIKK
ncbi:MAG: hypothetical protein PHC70_02310 [Patescibacteria group bacterium]|nr:hypothetical protein [Patescibacteria group bacterium]